MPWCPGSAQKKPLEGVLVLGRSRSPPGESGRPRRQASAFAAARPCLVRHQKIPQRSARRCRAATSQPTRSAARAAWRAPRRATLAARPRARDEVSFGSLQSVRWVIQSMAAAPRMRANSTMVVSGHSRFRTARLALGRIQARASSAIGRCAGAKGLRTTRGM
jgi:hypothetical protein